MTDLALEYAGLNATRLEAWQAFAESVLGVAAESGPGGSLRIRIDDRVFRLAIHETDDEKALAYIGWRCESPTAIDRIVARMRDRGVTSDPLSPDEIEARAVGQGVGFDDPDGYRIELTWGSGHRLDTRTIVKDGSPRSPARLTLGHVVIGVSDIDASLDFYLNGLGLRLTDLYEHRIAFLHCDQRHHSLALVGTDDVGVRHVMLETDVIADLGIIFDRALEEGWARRGLGQHVNDEAVTFYSRTPSESSIEFAWGSRLIDPETWSPRLIEGTMSYWGHPHL